MNKIGKIKAKMVEIDNFNLFSICNIMVDLKKNVAKILKTGQKLGGKNLKKRTAKLRTVIKHCHKLYKSLPMSHTV